MDESEKPQSRITEGLRHARKLRFNIGDAIFVLAFLIIVVALSITLINHIVAKRDVAGAQAVADKVIADIGKRDGAAAYKLGTKQFRSQITAEKLDQQFKDVQVATKGTPTLDRKILYKGPAGKSVYLIYKYPGAVPYYVRVASTTESGDWKLSSISGNIDESKLLPE